MTLPTPLPIPPPHRVAAFWQALGELACVAAFAEMSVRLCYYGLRPEPDGPADAEGISGDALIKLCAKAVQQRADLDQEAVRIFVEALELLHEVAKERNRLFHDCSAFQGDGLAVQYQSIKGMLPTTREVTVAQVAGAKEMLRRCANMLLDVFFIAVPSCTLQQYEGDDGTPSMRRLAPVAPVAASPDD